MKSFFIFVFSVSFVTSVLADVPQIRASKVSCREYQDAVKNYKVVKVLYRPVIVTKSLTISDEIECDANTVKAQGIFKTKDVVSCAAGFFCAPKDVVVDYVNPFSGLAYSGPVFRKPPQSLPTHQETPHWTPREPDFDPTDYDPTPTRGPSYNPTPTRGPSYDPTPTRGPSYNPTPGSTPRGPSYDPTPRGGSDRNPAPRGPNYNPERCRRGGC